MRIITISILLFAKIIYAATQYYNFGFRDSISCDGNEMVFYLTDQLPQPKISIEEFDKILNRDIDLRSYSINNGDTIFVSQLIDTGGLGICYTVSRAIDSSLSVILAKTIDTYVRWSPAKQRGQKVGPFKIGMKYAIINDKISTISLITNQAIFVDKRKHRKRK